MKKMKSIIVLGCVVMLIVSCAPFRQKEVMEEMDDPINCATAEGDIRMLEQEKVHLTQQILEGVSAITPAGFVIGVVTGTEEVKLKVAVGEYDRMIDERIAKIKAKCGVE